MLRAAWPIYNVDIESVKQLSSHPLLSSGSDKITLMPSCHLSMPTERTVSRTTKPCDWAFKTLPDLETHILQDAFLHLFSSWRPLSGSESFEKNAADCLTPQKKWVQRPAAF